MSNAELDDLQMLITSNEPNLILLTEILPKAKCNVLSRTQLSLHGYHGFDQSTKGKHGVAICV